MASVGQLIFDFFVDKNGLNAQLKQAEDDIQAFNRRIKDQEAIKLSLDFGALKTQLDQLKSQLAAARKSGDYELQVQLNSNIKQLQTQVTQAGRELTNYARVGSKDVSVLGNNFKSVNDTIREQGILSQKSLESIRGIGQAVAATGIGAGLLSISGATVTLASNLEQAKISFNTMLGSASAADSLLTELSDFAKKTPFELVGIRQNAKQLLAMGIESKNIIPTLKALGDVSSGLNVPLERLALAYGQVIAKGRLQGGELKQFTEAGVPLLKVLSEQLGVTEAKLFKMIEAGQVSSSEVVKAFESMSAAGGRFANLSEKQSKTYQGTVSNIKDNLGQLGEVIGGFFLPLLKQVAVNLNTLINGIRSFTERFPTLTKVIAFGAAGLGILLGFMGTLGFILPILTTATAAFGLSMTAALGPIGIAIGLVGALALGYDIYKTRQEESRIQNIATGKSIGQLNTEMEEAKKSLEALNKEYASGKITQAEYDEKSKALTKRIEDLGKASLYTTFTQEELNNAMARLASLDIKTDGDRRELELLAQQAKITAQALLEAANAKLRAFATESRLGQAEIERRQTANGERALTQAGGVAGISPFSLDSIQKISEDGVKLKAITDEVAKYETMLGDVEKAQKKLDALKTSGGGSALPSPLGAGKGGGSASEGVKQLSKSVKDYDDALDKVAKTTKKIKDEQEKYSDAVRSNTNDNINKLRELQREYSNTIKKIVDAREEELKSIEQRRNADKDQNTEQFAKDQAEKFAESLQKVIDLQIKLGRESDSQQRADIQKDINEELQKQTDIQASLTELRKIAGDQGVIDIDNIIKEAELRAKMTDSQRELYDFKVKQQEVDKKAAEDVQKTEQKALDEALKAQQELADAKASIETQKKIIEELQKVKSITKAQVESFLDSEKFRSFDDESQKLLEKLLELKLSISNAKKEKGLATTDAKQKEIALEQELAALQESNLGKLSSKYKELSKQFDDLQAKGDSVLGEADGLGGFTKGGTKKSDKVLGGIDKTQVVSEEQTLQNDLFSIKKKAQEDDIIIEQEDSARDIANKQAETDLHIQTVQNIQAVTQGGLIQMQNIRSNYYANITSQTSRAVTAMIGQYNLLANSLRQVIALQRQANSGGGAGFASGGYTGTGGKYEVAGLVHKGEYVVPQWMVNKYGGVINQLEGVRNRGFAEGGFTNTTNRSVNINGPINMRDGMDFDKAMDYRRRKI